MKPKNRAAKQILTVGTMKGDGSERQVNINLAAVRGLLYEEAVKPESPSGRLTIRQLERIHAKTGVPWYLVSREAEKEGL